MSIDLTEAVEAAARARWEFHAAPGVTWDTVVEHNPIHAHNMRESALVEISAATPLIEAQVRAQIGQAIDNHGAVHDRSADWRDGVEEAGRIARGES